MSDIPAKLVQNCKEGENETDSITESTHQKRELLLDRHAL